MSRYDIDTVDLLKLIFKLSRSDFDFSIYLPIFRNPLLCGFVLVYFKLEMVHVKHVSRYLYIVVAVYSDIE